MCRPAGKEFSCAWPPGEHQRYAFSAFVLAGEVRVTTGPQDPAVAGRDRLRAGHADREDVIETLKNAFVHGRLTKDELNLRVGQALAARTHAALAALTTDIPSAPAGPVRPPAPARRRPLARAAARSGTCLIVAVPAFWFAGYTDPFGPWRGVMVALFVCALWTAVGIMGYALFTAWDQKSPRRQLPPRPGAQALQAEQRSGTGRGPVPPAPRPDQTRADLRARSSPQRRQHIHARASRAHRGLRPTPGTL
jgi:Domain of unknown function (DUF1707)